MMISTRGRYALRMLVDMAEHRTEGYLPLKEIAERQGISEKYLESIVKTLVQNHILTGLRGKGGGYRLTREPDQYTVASILRLTEGTLAPVSCLEENAQACPIRDECRTLPMWRRLDELIHTFFEGITLADLMNDAPDGDNYVI